jgi:hypothetical protein
MPRKKITTRTRIPRRRRYQGGAYLGSLGENNINALNRLSVGENNLRAIELLELPKPPLQPTGQIVRMYPVTGSVPFIDRARGYLKRTKIISRGARKLGLNRVADFAEQRGYGRKRRSRIRGGSALVDKYGEYIHAY